MTNQWIKCSERLPDITINNHRAILAYDQHDEIFFIWATDIKDSAKYNGVTHWMELPDRPEREE